MAKNNGSSMSGQMDIFEYAGESRRMAPLSERMRPTTLDEFVGQEHIVGQGKLLRRAIATNTLGSCIFYGGPGCGKTTLANIIANTCNAEFIKLNAVSASVVDARRVIDEAKERLRLYSRRTYLLLDECHRWSKAQSDCVLSAIEEGYITFIGSTTENPYVSMTKAIVSRCRVFEFYKLEDADIVTALRRALSDKTKGLGNYNTLVDDVAISHIVWAAVGDLRSALNAIELAVVTTPPTSPDGKIHITREIAEESIQKKALSIDDSIYYDMLSAFCKSMRGSDADAALYWSERLIQAGVDPMLIARRLVVHAAEDVGMADPLAQLMAVSAITAYKELGLPEGRIPLANAIVYVCEASKSNSVINALQAANHAVLTVMDDNVPISLRDTNYKGEQISGYKYPHDYGGWVEQQYLPDKLKDSQFYLPSKNGREGTLVRAKIVKKPT